MIYLANMMISHSYVKLPEGTKQLLIGMMFQMIPGSDMAPTNQENKSFGRLFQWDVSFLSFFIHLWGS